jgi:hypothetical protein
MAGETGPLSILLPWYATTFRADKFEAALLEIAPVAPRYGATSYHVHRSLEDPYRFWHWTAVPDKLTWEKYWYGSEFRRWRAEHAGWFVVPITYNIARELAFGRIEPEEAELGAY